jgi:hypothetical protein
MSHSSPTFFTHGHAVDLVIAIIVVEFTALSFISTKSQGHMIDRVLAFTPGVCLLLSLRAALTGASWVWTAAFLTASFPVHVGDLVRRRL